MEKAIHQEEPEDADGPDSHRGPSPSGSRHPELSADKLTATVALWDRAVLCIVMQTGLPHLGSQNQHGQQIHVPTQL